MGETIYGSHAGGGYGSGTTSGTTGRDPLHGTQTFDDQDEAINAKAQAEALRAYQPRSDEKNNATVINSAELHGLLPHDRVTQVPDTGRAHVQRVDGIPVSPETEQAAAQLAQDNEISALSDLNGGDVSAADR